MGTSNRLRLFFPAGLGDAVASGRSQPFLRGVSGGATFSDVSVEVDEDLGRKEKSFIARTIEPVFLSRPNKLP
jgi:hypothetical protein